MTDGTAGLSVGAIVICAFACPAGCRALLIDCGPNPKAGRPARQHTESEAASTGFMAAFFGILGLLCALPFYTIRGSWSVVAYVGGVYFGTVLLGTLFAMLTKSMIWSGYWETQENHLEDEEGGGR